MDDTNRAILTEDRAKLEDMLKQWQTYFRMSNALGDMGHSVQHPMLPYSEKDIILELSRRNQLEESANKE